MKLELILHHPTCSDNLDYYRIDYRPQLVVAGLGVLAVLLVVAVVLTFLQLVSVVLLFFSP